MKSSAQWPLEVGTQGILSAGRWLKLRAVLWATLLSAGAFGFFAATQFLESWLHLPPNSVYVVFLVLPILAFVTYAYVVRAAEKRTAVEIMPAKGMLLELVLGGALGFAMICAVTTMLWTLGLYNIHSNHWQHIFDAFLFGPYLSGMMEELLFRAILLRIFARCFGMQWGLVISSMLFGLAHMGHATWVQAAQITLNGGVIMSLLYMATGRLWMSIGMHVAWDFTEDSIVGAGHRSGLFLSTPAVGKPDWLTGGKFGPDGSALVSLIGILVIGTILFARQRDLFPESLRSKP